MDAAVDPRFGRCACFLIVETDDLTFEAVENPNVMLGGGAGIQSAQLMSEKGVRFVLTGNCGPNAYRTLSAAGIPVITGCSGPVRDVVAQFQAGGVSATGGPNVEGHFGMGTSDARDEAASSALPPDQAVPPATSRATESHERGPAVPDAAANPVGPGSGVGGIGPGMGQRRGGRQGRRMGRGSGGGTGRGMGRGMGRGLRQGRGGGAAFGAGQATPSEPSEGPTRAEELRMLQEQADQLGRQMLEIQERIRHLEEGE